MGGTVSCWKGRWSQDCGVMCQSFGGVSWVNLDGIQWRKPGAFHQTRGRTCPFSFGVATAESNTKVRTDCSPSYVKHPLEGRIEADMGGMGRLEQTGKILRATSRKQASRRSE